MGDVHDGAKFELHLEEEKSSELGHKFSKLEPEAVRDLEDGDPLLELTTHESYISGEWRTVQPADKFAEHSSVCLLVICFTFHPKSGRRFKHAKLSCVISQDQPTDPKPVIRHLFPKLSYGNAAAEEETKHWTLAVQASEPTGHASLGLDRGHETAKTVQHYMKITGSKRGSPSSRAVWDLNENPSSEAGIPHTFLAAMVVSAECPFVLTITVDGTVAGGNTGITRSFKTALASKWKIDPALPKGHQYAVANDLQELKLGEWFSGCDESAQTRFADMLPLS